MFNEINNIKIGEQTLKKPQTKRKLEKGLRKNLRQFNENKHKLTFVIYKVPMIHIKKKKKIDIKNVNP